MRSVSSPATAGFPFLVLDAARAQGHEVTVVAVKDEAFPELADAAARDAAGARCTGCRSVISAPASGSSRTPARQPRGDGRAGQAREDFSGIVPDLTLLSVLRG